MEISNNMLAIMAIVLAMGIVGMVAIDISAILQNAEAKGCENGFPNSETGFNASQGRCFGH
jgi:hypothetical protein